MSRFTAKHNLKGGRRVQKVFKNLYGGARISETKYEDEPLMIDCMNRCREECKREVNILKNKQLNFGDKLTPTTSFFLNEGTYVQLRGAHHYRGKKSLAPFIRDLKKKFKVLKKYYN